MEVLVLITDRNPALRDPEIRRAYEEEMLFGEATDTVEALLESLGMTRAELARRLQVSRGRVSQILSGDENLTLKSLGALGWALGIRFELVPAPMADRRGTPAEHDAPAPAWLSRLRDGTALRFHDVSLPERGRISLHPRPALRVVDGTAAAA